MNYTLSLIRDHVKEAFRIAVIQTYTRLEVLFKI